MENYIHIIIVSSEYYIPYTSVLIISILENKSVDDNIYLHIVSQDISEKSKYKINQICQNIPVEYKFVSTEQISKFSNCTLQHMMSNICNCKLIFSDLFTFDKALCLEADMVVTGSLKEIYNYDIKNCPMIAVRDPICDVIKKQFNISDKYRYVNTGMFLANFAFWRKNKVINKFIEANDKYKDNSIFTSLLDQNIFNIVFHKDMKYFPFNYNCFIEMKYNNEKEKELAMNNPLIIHWANYKKPWNYDVNLDFLFWKYARLSPFYEEILKRYILAFSHTENTQHQENPHTKTTIKLFNFLPIFKKNSSLNKVKFNFLGLPLFKKKSEGNKIKYYFLRIPIWKTKIKGNVQKGYLFGIIPLLKRIYK